ncbi:MAG: protochlorophyllide oxidoreductase [Aliifodinibius sp.]|nr:protochlorophyllide oxidoreductase [Fodinibius sp.]NIV14246.1 protochlorophyllide oxidoreductase [Fodinibius sp.]NIY29589.1 protochlorophyllide oxidoreductase [Fodinibius sp.]
MWTKEAEERLNRIPSFVRAMAKKGIEQYAAEQGYGEINNAVMDEVKDIYGM